MSTTPDDPYTGLAVAIGRIEEGIRSVNDKLDTLAAESTNHSNTLTGHEARLAVIESHRQPRVHWLTIVVGIIAILGFGLAVFDRMYTT